jgi:hypothetical protein
MPNIKETETFFLNILIVGYASQRLFTMASMFVGGGESYMDVLYTRGAICLQLLSSLSKHILDSSEIISF